MLLTTSYTHLRRYGTCDFLRGANRRQNLELYLVIVSILSDALYSAWQLETNRANQSTDI